MATKGSVTSPRKVKEGVRKERKRMESVVSPEKGGPTGIRSPKQKKPKRPRAKTPPGVEEGVVGSGVSPGTGGSVDGGSGGDGGGGGGGGDSGDGGTGNADSKLEGRDSDDGSAGDASSESEGAASDDASMEDEDERKVKTAEDNADQRKMDLIRDYRIFLEEDPETERWMGLWNP